MCSRDTLTGQKLKSTTRSVFHTSTPPWSNHFFLFSTHRTMSRNNTEAFYFRELLFQTDRWFRWHVPRRLWHWLNNEKSRIYGWSISWLLFFHRLFFFDTWPCPEAILVQFMWKLSLVSRVIDVQDFREQS